jgi:ATP-binding cassette, subfamily B, multidrug efflux pump
VGGHPLGAQLGAIWPYIRADLSWYGAAILAAPVTAGLVVLQPWLLKAAIDRGVTAGDPDLLVRFALAYLAVGAAGFLVEALYTLTIGVGATRTINSLRDAVYAHALSLAPSFHDREPTGRLLTRVTSDVEALGETLTAGAFTIVLDVLLVLSVLAAMLALDPALTAVLLLVAPPLAAAIEGIRRKMRVLYVAIRTHLAEMIAFAAERIAGIEVVQLYGDEARAQALFDERLDRYRRANVTTNVWDALLFALVDGVSTITMALMLWYAVSPWFEGAVTAGLLAAFVDYIGRLFTPVRELSNKISILQRAASAVDKIAGLLLRDERVRYGARPLPELPGDVELDGVWFAYGDGPDVLRDVSLTVRPGEVVALVGRTGSGKTTIGKLLTRMYEGYRGRIRFDGVSLDEVSRAALRARVAVVQQDVVLFGGSVRFNLTLGSPISDARLRAALALAQVSDVVERLGGLDGRIAQGGRNLSAGEAQLLSFARVLARDAPLVILDEATASVDSLTEARIQAATEALFEHRTVLVVAHRLSTITHADRIVLLDHGRIVEEGSHAALLSRGGAYAALFEAQFERARPGPGAGPPGEALGDA